MRQMENELPRQERLEKLFDDLVKHIEIDAALLREYAEEVCDIYFFFLFDIVFLLMYCISKLSGSSIANACKKRDCNNCLECRTSFGRIKKKYPYVFWFNIIGACFCGILCYLCK